jgi:light-independent protochlorophyllide reductase subunit L
MSQSIAIFGKASVGKTFAAAHLGMAMGYAGDKTLVVGCDQKRDVSRALSREVRPSLMEALETVNYNYDLLDLNEVTASAGADVDVMELGPSQLVVGHYGDVLEEAFHLFDQREIYQRYSRVIFDVNDERFDAVFAPLMRRVQGAIAVCDDTTESLFVLNRLLRAVLIGGSEFGLSLRLVGVVHNRSVNPAAFERYVERTRAFPLITINEIPELARLRTAQRTLFAADSLPPHLDRIVVGFLKIAEMMRGQPFNLVPMMPLEDEEIWQLAPGIKSLN